MGPELRGRWNSILSRSARERHPESRSRPRLFKEEVRISLIFSTSSRGVVGSCSYRSIVEVEINMDPSGTTY